MISEDGSNDTNEGTSVDIAKVVHVVASAGDGNKIGAECREHRYEYTEESGEAADVSRR